MIHIGPHFVSRLPGPLPLLMLNGPCQFTETMLHHRFQCLSDLATEFTGCFNGGGLFLERLDVHGIHSSFRPVLATQLRMECGVICVKTCPP